MDSSRYHIELRTYVGTIAEIIMFLIIICWCFEEQRIAGQMTAVRIRRPYSP